MTDRKIYRVICNLTGDEYQRLSDLAQSDLRHSQPLVEITTSREHRINEAHIGRIAADALYRATGMECASDAQDAVENHVQGWAIGDKVKLLTDAGQDWVPPSRGRTSNWLGSQKEAQEFLNRHPAVDKIIGTGKDEGVPKENAYGVHAVITAEQELIEAIEERRMVSRRIGDYQEADEADTELSRSVLDGLDRVSAFLSGGAVENKLTPAMIREIAQEWRTKTEENLHDLDMTLERHGDGAISVIDKNGKEVGY